MLILLPKHDIDLDEFDIPFFYLIGPVLGGDNWQTVMCLYLEQFAGNCIIATPCRWDKKEHALGVLFRGTIGNYERQLNWEHVYIEAALKRPRSCLVAWLPAESRNHPREDGNPYGRDTYGELGYFRGLLESNRRLPLVVGSDGYFCGFDVIRRNFDHAYGARFPFCISKKEVAQAAAKRVHE